MCIICNGDFLRRPSFAMSDVVGPNGTAVPVENSEEMSAVSG